MKTPEPTPASAVASAPATPDDSGIIDLKALSTRPPAAMAMSPLTPVSPLFNSDAPNAFAVDANQPKAAGGIPRHFKIIGAIAAAAVFLVVSGIGLRMAFRGEEPVARNALTAPVQPAAVTAAIAPPAAAPAPESKPAEAAQSTSSSSDDANEPTAKAKKKKKRGKHASAAGATSSGDTASKPVVASKPSKPAGDSCGCKGDFNCILRCTAKGK